MSDYDDVKYCQRIIDNSDKYTTEEVVYARLLLKCALHHQIQEQIVSELRSQMNHR